VAVALAVLFGGHDGYGPRKVELHRLLLLPRAG
jgi:hypothetical protein